MKLSPTIFSISLKIIACDFKKMETSTYGVHIFSSEDI
jgi:hypothetical protein